MIFPWIYFLQENEQLFIESFTKKWVVNGPGRVFTPPFVSVRKRKGLTLSPTEFVKTKSQLTGEIKVQKGPCLLQLDAYEEIAEKHSVFVLQHNEYLKTIDKKTGEINVKIGPGNVVLGSNENLLVEPTRGINIDEHTAVLVRNTGDGSLKLETENKVFFPKADEEIEAVQKKILLENHEAVIVKNKEGRYQIIHGSNENSSFFLKPFEKLVTLWWSAGINKDGRTLKITHIDSRPKFMWYEFGVRTKDNVELILGVTFFWQIIDIEKMVKTTDDAPGDVCSHARSIIIQSISKSSLESFLDSFNDIVREAVNRPDDDFYDERGVKIHSVEVRSVSCKEDSTQQILQNIIQETTNRLNRLQKQQSENEVALQRVKGSMEIEKQKGDLLEIQRINAIKEAKIAGESEAAKVRQFFDQLENCVSEKEKIHIFDILKKVDYIEKLSKGDASMFFTPSDIDLRIETKR